MNCPCHSGRPYADCCLPLHAGAPAASPEALMRSRYAAYSLGLADYVVATTDPDGPQWDADLRRWRAAIARFCGGTDFAGLKIRGSGEEGDEGWVSFRAELRQGGADASFGEWSRFRRVGGRWLYHSGRPEQGLRT